MNLIKKTVNAIISKHLNLTRIRAIYCVPAPSRLVRSADGVLVYGSSPEALQDNEIGSKKFSSLKLVTAVLFVPIRLINVFNNL